MKRTSVTAKIFLVLTGVIFILSLIRPYDYLTWILESFPAIIGFSLIFWTRKTFRLTNFLLILICLHSIILFVGAHYTYALVPAGNWAKEFFGFSRNHYDRLGHFFQGFEPAFLAREILLRKKVLKNDAWLKFIVLSICLGFSAFYELIEFAVAMVLNTSSDAFLGTQGDVWDTQKDMLFAMIGAICALLFARFHDKSLEKV
jgi:putative membrane protein